MTRKDYELIAKVLREFGEPNGQGENSRPVDDRDEIAYLLASALQAENPRFDRAKFLRACSA